MKKIITTLLLACSLSAGAQKLISHTVELSHWYDNYIAKTTFVDPEHVIYEVHFSIEINKVTDKISIIYEDYNKMVDVLLYLYNHKVDAGDYVDLESKDFARAIADKYGWHISKRDQIGLVFVNPRTAAKLLNGLGISVLPKDAKDGKDDKKGKNEDDMYKNMDSLF